MFYRGLSTSVNLLNIDTFPQAIRLTLYSIHFKTKMIQEETYDLFDLILTTPEGLEGGPQWSTTLLSSFVPWQNSQQLIWCFCWGFLKECL